MFTSIRTDMRRKARPVTDEAGIKRKGGKERTRMEQKGKGRNRKGKKGKKG